MITPKTRSAAAEERREQVLAYIRMHIEARSYPPSVREIAAHFEMSEGSAHADVQKLVAEGRLRRTPGASRALAIVEMG